MKLVKCIVRTHKADETIDALKEIDSSFKFLDDYYGADASTRAVLDKLHALTKQKLSELEVAIRLYDEGRSAASTDIVLSELNKQQMEAIRTHSAQLLEPVAWHVVASREDIYRTLMLSRVGLAALSAICLLAMYLYLRHVLTHP